MRVQRARQGLQIEDTSPSASESFDAVVQNFKREMIHVFKLKKKE
jgi:hypothetical protein